MLWLGIGAGVILVLAGLVYLGNQVSKQEAEKAQAIIAEIDQIYGDYMTRILAETIIQEDSMKIDEDEVLQKTMLVLKPHVNALIHTINSCEYSDIDVKYKSETFTNIVSLVEDLYDRSRRNGDQVLSSTDQDLLTENLEVAIRADISKRLMLL